MDAPERFGLNSTETLAHVGERSLVTGHPRFWSAFRDQMPRDCELTPVDEDADFSARCGAHGVTHLLRSAGDVRVGVRLDEPREPVRGVMLHLHGYDVTPSLSAPEPTPGVAHCQLRVRGFAGSLADAGALVANPEGWICAHIENPQRWSLHGAAQDVVRTLVALRNRFGSAPLLAIRAESFGAGLGVIASASAPPGVEPQRLAIGLPSLGDWPWRLSHDACGDAGIGAEVARWLLRHPSESDAAIAALRLFDAVVHAPRVRAATLCKLACRDSVVPAPSAAAIFNALGVNPGDKWRYVVEFGHFDGGMADLRRHAEFAKLATEFLNPDVDPAGLMRQHGAAAGGRSSSASTES